MSNFFWEGEGTLPLPMRSFTEKEYHIGSEVSTMSATDKHTDRHPVTFI